MARHGTDETEDAGEGELRGSAYRQRAKHQEASHLRQPRASEAGAGGGPAASGATTAPPRSSQIGCPLPLARRRSLGFSTRCGKIVRLARKPLSSFVHLYADLPDVVSPSMPRDVAGVVRRPPESQPIQDPACGLLRRRTASSIRTGSSVGQVTICYRPVSGKAIRRRSRRRALTQTT